MDEGLRRWEPYVPEGEIPLKECNGGGNLNDMMIKSYFSHPNPNVRTPIDKILDELPMKLKAIEHGIRERIPSHTTEWEIEEDTAKLNILIHFKLWRYEAYSTKPTEHTLKVNVSKSPMLAVEFMKDFIDNIVEAVWYYLKENWNSSHFKIYLHPPENVLIGEPKLREMRKKTNGYHQKVEQESEEGERRDSPSEAEVQSLQEDKRPLEDVSDKEEPETKQTD